MGGARTPPCPRLWMRFFVKQTFFIVTIYSLLSNQLTLTDLAFFFSAILSTFRLLRSQCCCWVRIEKTCKDEGQQKECPIERKASEWLSVNNNNNSLWISSTSFIIIPASLHQQQSPIIVIIAETLIRGQLCQSYFIGLFHAPQRAVPSSHSVVLLLQLSVVSYPVTWC